MDKKIQPDSLPIKLSKPAQRAFEAAGINDLKTLAKWSEKEIAALHGVGKNTLIQIKKVFAENGLSFTKK